ncbi:MAG: hypothetical protein KDB90_04120 [Planctomycetes bacterium]|nr:hypothetical protein [Planctomycetota bacterium]
MEGNEGSKYMTIYIVACFALAMVALMGYKFANQDREELSNEYVDLAGKFADMSAAYAPNINDYYRKVEDGLIKPPDQKMMDATQVTLTKLAEDSLIKDGSGADDHLDMGSMKEKVVNKLYIEYSLQVELKNVTQTQWAVFLSQSQHATREYASLESIKIARSENRYARIDISKDHSSDYSLWNVTINFVWYGPLNKEKA